MNTEGFNIWFPALVGGLVVGLLVAALWDVLRRKTWCFASRFWPGVLKEVGLENSCLSRAEVEEKQREVTDMLSALSTQITRSLVPVKQSMAEAAQYSSSSGSSNCGAICKFDLESQTGNNPAYTPITFTVTAYFPDDTPGVVIRPTKKFFKRYAKGTVKRWRSSIILQTPMPIEPCVLAEIGELARNCMLEDNRCVFQLGNWAILYYNVGEVHLHILKEGDVPVNVEARWQPERTDITMRGLYLNGAQVKVATKDTSTILRSDGPAIQGARDLDELHLPTEEVDFPGEDSYIYASKVVEADGISLLVRSEASFILPPRGTFTLIEALCGQLERISSFAKEMINFFLQTEDRRPKTTPNLSELRVDHEHLELVVEHWNGVSEIELLDYRKEVLHYLQELQASGVVERAGPPSLDSHMIFSRDEHYLEYWQEGLQVLNEVILRNSSNSHSHTHIRVRGGIQFLLGDFESALQDLDLAYLKMGGHRSTVLLDRALVKCMLGRYSEALQDVVAIIALSPNVNDIQELQTCIRQTLDQHKAFQIVAQSGPLCQQSLLHDQDNSVVEIPDILTGDEWRTGESESFRPVSDNGNAGGSTFDPSSKRAKSVDVARIADGSMTSLAKPGTSQYYGVRFRPDLEKWVAEIRVAQWKAEYKKVWLGTFETEQAAARGVDLARKLVKCSKKHPPNLPCEKVEAYTRQIPPQLILTDLTDTSMFQQVPSFVNLECQEYVASFDDTPSEQIIPAFDQHDSFGGQFFSLSGHGFAGAGTDSPASSCSGITPSGSPGPVTLPANSTDAHEVDEKPETEKKSSRSFHFHKSEKSAKQLPNEFLCPISKCLMTDPVIIASGESYERLCIQIWLQQGNRHCFKTGQTLDHQNLTPNIALRTAIQTWCAKHKVLNPEVPTFQHATQSVEDVVRTTFISDGSDPPTPADSVDNGRPGFSSDPARPGFGNDDVLDGDTRSAGNSGTYGLSYDARSAGNSGSYGLSYDGRSPANSRGFDQREDHYSSQGSQGDEVGPIERAGQPTWSLPRGAAQDGPLWNRRPQTSHSRMKSSGSRESSRDFDRGSSSAEYTGSSGNGRSWHGSSDHGIDSSEWPSSTSGHALRYVHSALASTLREDVESFHGRGRTPLPLQTTPSSYGRDRSEAPGQTQEGDGIEGELIYKLQHPQPLQQEEAAAEIRRLTRNTEPGLDYRLALCTPGLLAALLPLLQSQYVDVQINAVAALMNLSLANENKIKIAQAGVVPSLVELLKGSSDATQEHSAGALFSLALTDVNKMVIGVLGAIPPLIHVLQSGPPGAQRDAAMALYHLSFTHINRSKLIKAGAVPILLQLVQEASSDLLSRALLILSNLAATQEGRFAISEGRGVSVFVRLLSAGMEGSVGPGADGDSDSSSRGGSADWASVREHAAAALLQLANQNLRFKGQALQAGAVEPLVALQEHGTQRARDKATALLNILRNNKPNGQDEALYMRASYQRRGPRGGDGHSGGDHSASQRPDSAQF